MNREFYAGVVVSWEFYTSVVGIFHNTHISGGFHIIYVSVVEITHDST